MTSPHAENTSAPPQCSALGLDFPWMTSSPGAHLSDGILSTPSSMCGPATFPVGYTPSPFGKPWYHDLAREDLLPATGPLMDLLQGRTCESYGSRESLGEFLDWSVASTSLRPQSRASSPIPGMVPFHMYPGAVDSGIIQPQGLYLVDEATSNFQVDSSSRLSIASSGYHSSLSPAASDSVDSPPPVADTDDGFGDVGSPTSSGDLQQDEPILDPIKVKMEGVKSPEAHLPSGQDNVDVGHTMNNDNHIAMNKGHGGHVHMDIAETCSPVGAAQEQPNANSIKRESEKPTPKTTKTTSAPAAKKGDTSAKPAVTYIELVARALLTAKNHKLILADIYAYILQNYPYYETAPKTWRNAVRHNLCVNDCFYKAERSNSGRGFFWAIHPACVQMFKQGDFRRTQARRLAQQMDITKRTSSTISQATRGTTAKPNQHHLSNSQEQQYLLGTPQTASGHVATQVVRVAPGMAIHQQQQQQQPSHMYQVAAPYSSYGPTAYDRSHGPMISGNNYQYYHFYNGPTSSTPTTNSQGYYTMPMYK